MDQAALKQTIREELLLRRKSLGAEERLRKSQEISERLIRLDQFQDAQWVHLYLSNAEEVKTTSLIQTVLRLKKRVAVPVIDVDSRRLRLSELTHLETGVLEIGPFGIRQPRPAFQKEIYLNEIDLWIIPGVAFDPSGNRLGHGGGYYDRILHQIDRTIIGLSFELQILDQLPLESTDVQVDVIITEKRIIFCREVRSDRENN